MRVRSPLGDSSAAAACDVRPPHGDHRESMMKIARVGIDLDACALSVRTPGVM